MQRRWPHDLRAGRATRARGVLRWLVAGVLTVVIAPAESRAACGDFGLPEGSEIVEFETALGSICLELLREDAPLTVANFVGYIERGDYDGTVVHRSAPGFVIQGGGFAPSGNVLAPIATDPAVPNEPCVATGGVCAERGNEAGTVAMAKFPNLPNSATSQWFINLTDNRTSLDTQNGGGGFTVFARVLGDTFSVVEAIEALPIADQVAGFFLGPVSGTAFSTVPLLSPVPALASPFGCWDPSEMSMMLTFVQNPSPPPQFTLAGMADVATGGRFFLSSACGEVITSWPFVPNPPQMGCPTGDLFGVAVDDPAQTLASPVAATFPPNAAIPPNFNYSLFFLTDQTNPLGFLGVAFRCPQLIEALNQRAAWRADLWNRASPELVVIEQASVRVVPEPGAAVGVAAFAALGILVRRRARRS